MKRVLIYSLAYYPNFVSGAEAAIKEITDRIAPEDIEFHMLTVHFDSKLPRQELLGNVHVHRIGFGPGYLKKVLFIPLAALRARLLDKQLHFDAQWSMMTYMLFPVVLARWIGVKAPHILTLQDGDLYEKVFERPFIKPVAWILDSGFRTARIVQVISSYLGEWPRKRGYMGPIELVHNGANPKDIKESVSPEEITAVQQKLGKQPGETWLVNTARLVEQKAFDVTIRALKLLPANVKLLIVGGGPDEEMLKSLVKELDLGSRVIFTGNVDRSEVTKYRKASDIFVGPSRSEGLGNAFLSAMASRLPVVATQEGGLAEFVFDEKRNPGKEMTAWAVDKDSPEQIAAAVKDIMDNPEKAKKVTTAARQMVLEKYDWDMIAKQMRERVFAPVVG